jgi:cytochrome d ubiquinol oxidase subunit I
VDEEKQDVKFGLAIPGFLSYLIYGNFSTPVTGLNAFKPEDQPPINIVFQTYHLMVAIGFTLIAICIFAAFLWWRNKLFDYKWFLYVLVFAVLLPQIANQIGWISAEVGRQPWIVYGLLRTSDALSKAVSADQIIFSLVMFMLIYSLLFVLFIYLLNEKIKKGPELVEETSTLYGTQKEIFSKN